MVHNQIVLFEDAQAQGQLFRPLTYTRPFAELLVGCYSAIERVLTYVAPDVRLILHCRAEIAPLVRERYPGLLINEIAQSSKTLFINSRLLLSDHLFSQIASADNSVVRWDDQPQDILGFNIVGTISESIIDKVVSGKPITNEEIELEERNLPKAKIFTSLWNMVNSNPVVIQSDVKRILNIRSRVFSLALQTNTKLDATNLKNIHVDESVSFVRPCILDATNGPIFIEENVVIEANATIIGPVVIRAGSLIKAGAIIHPGVTVGPVSKIGGEVENSIIQGYSNKQHDGYLGHSFIGQWCNLGAGTNTSDLKNDYTNVKIMIEGEEFDTKSLFVGLLMGDHSKSAIGTQFNTGTTVGVCCNIFSIGFPPKCIPSFSWCGPDGIQVYRTDKALDVAKTVMARRGKVISEEEEVLLRSLSS